MPVPFSELTTPSGHKCGEAASALQKSVRRGMEREALYWAAELSEAGFGGYVWRRLRIMASEDIGLASTETVIAVRVLFENWQDAKKAKKEAELPLFIAHAVLLLARAPKSGIALHATMAIWMGDRAAMGMAIPDEALDVHTRRGRRMGRGRKHFLEEAGRLENETLPDEWFEEGAKAWLEEERKQEAPASELSSDQLELGDGEA